MVLRKTSPAAGQNSPQVTGFYDKDTGSVQYVVADPETGKAALIDVVAGFDPKSARRDLRGADDIADFTRAEGLEVVWVLDTHPHADHLMASKYLSDKLSAPNAIGEKTCDIGAIWEDIYNLPGSFDVADCFDRLLGDGDEIKIGNLPVKVMLTPGHTLGSVTYVVGDDAAFVNDSFMQPDVGSSRADFPGGDAGVLFDSLQKILSLPDKTRLFVGHDYGTDTREEPAWEATVAEQRAENKHIGGGTGRAQFIKLREERDAGLPLPDRMLHVLQMNLRAGQLPGPEADEARYLKIPLNKF
ncbi:MAG: MBL fold metallo-hydrolase [Sulfitobacter sp.]